MILSSLGSKTCCFSKGVHISVFKNIRKRGKRERMSFADHLLHKNAV